MSVHPASPHEAEPTSDDGLWTSERRRRLKGVLAAVVAIVVSAAVAAGGFAVPHLSWMFPPGWYPTALTLLILLVLAPGVLLVGASSLFFGLTVGWPRHRAASTALMIGVASVFVGLYLLPMTGLDEQGTGYIVVAATLLMTFLLAPAVGGMLVRHGMRGGREERSEEG